MLQACLNGGRTRAFHLAVPYSADELSADAWAVVSSGAHELHIHPRGADGLESLEAGDIAAALEAVRRSVPGIPVGVSTGAWIRPRGRARQRSIRGWSALPDYVSVNLVEDDAAEVIAFAVERGIGVEAGLRSVRDVERFLALPHAPRCLRALIEIFEQDEAEALTVARAVLARLEEARSPLPRLLHGSEATMWSLYREALRLGLDARIGLEDGNLLPSGETASGNADQIAAAAAMARS